MVSARSAESPGVASLPGAFSVFQADGVGEFVAVVFQLGVVAAEFAHQIGERVGYGVEFLLGGVVCAGLGVLQEGDQ